MQPVGWCIADSEASEVIEIFLSSVKARSPDTSVNVIMTDDGTTHTASLIFMHKPECVHHRLHRMVCYKGSVW